MTEPRTEIAALLHQLSHGWRNREYAALADCFHESVVMLLPGLAGRVSGREALVESYREFMDRATIDDYREDAPTIDVWGDTALAQCRWEMTWTSGGKQDRAAGSDLFALTRMAGGGWKVVWRYMLVDEGR